MASDFLVVDIETYDPNLLELGPGMYRKDGYVLGVAIRDTLKGTKEYVNIRHKGITEEERTRNIAYVKEALDNDRMKVGANYIYDLDWLREDLGIPVRGRLEDVQSRECLLDAYAMSYSLDTLSLKYGFQGKHDEEINQWCKDNGLKLPAQSHLYLMPFDMVERYALGDLEETENIFLAQEERLVAEQLTQVNDLECDLIPLLVDMRRTGFRVDEARRQEVSDILTANMNEAFRDFEKKYNCRGININSGGDLTKLFNKQGIPLTYTEKNNASFSAEVLGFMEDPIGREIIELRGYKTVINNYVNGSLLRSQVNGRIHSTLVPLRKDDAGAVTGRFACRDPNLQQIPSKKEKNGDLIRSIFIPEDDCWLGAPDYSQIEYRIFLHFAIGPGADEVRKLFNDNPRTDYHKYVQDITGLDRKHAKNFNFGTLYFMGKGAMRRKFGFSVEQCDSLSDQYFGKMPFVKPTRNRIVDVVKKRGYVRTLMGRRARLADAMGGPDAAYKIVNYLVQGSAADVMKKGMVDAYKAGIYKELPIHMTVHDETPCSVGRTKAKLEAYREYVHIMENAVTIDVPLRVDCDLGTSWGDMMENVDLEGTIKEEGTRIITFSK